jgi:hypothetical protein
MVIRNIVAPSGKITSEPRVRGRNGGDYPQTSFRRVMPEVQRHQQNHRLLNSGSNPFFRTNPQPDLPVQFPDVSHALRHA